MGMMTFSHHWTSQAPPLIRLVLLGAGNTRCAMISHYFLAADPNQVNPAGSNHITGPKTEWEMRAAPVVTRPYLHHFLGLSNTSSRQIRKCQPRRREAKKRLLSVFLWMTAGVHAARSSRHCTVDPRRGQCQNQLWRSLWAWQKNLQRGAEERRTDTFSFVQHADEFRCLTTQLLGTQQLEQRSRS